ncbi:FMN-dependent NADH-azoreductase [Sphingobium sp. SYK-6]|uniref:FMN-dependent NADH-azoreductase n=1 Tax=Sphingobium sp. (strain NBRC 103272 / SYK-6) TaxID=627192 RepID=UPI0002276894|nr:FMN-dependent NADH-azoreductase [Sphingobium sp. SYK-6]BAK65316.1 FMN-dependent NADH-azoreductase [Sphingobium sp. SYK-6]
MNLLHIDSSIQGDASLSRAMSAAVVSRLRALHPDVTVTYRDLAEHPLPHMTLPGFATPEAQAVLEEFLAADVVVIGVPMYNFTISSQLKAWLDHIAIAGKTFRYTEQGPVGLAGDKRVILALSRGGFYSEGPAASMEHAETYLRAILGFMGITAPELVLAEGAALGPDQREAALAGGLEAANRIEPTPAESVA